MWQKILQCIHIVQYLSVIQPVFKIIKPFKLSWFSGGFCNQVEDQIYAITRGTPREDHQCCRTEHSSRHVLMLPLPAAGNEMWWLCHELSNPSSPPSALIPPSADSCCRWLLWLLYPALLAERRLTEITESESCLHRLIDGHLNLYLTNTGPLSYVGFIYRLQTLHWITGRLIQFTHHHWPNWILDLDLMVSGLTQTFFCNSKVNSDFGFTTSQNISASSVVYCMFKGSK